MDVRRAAAPLWVVLAAVALTVLLTWPILPRIANGARLNYGDAEWSIWVVNWVAHALSTDPRSLYQANIFHPQHDALAFSEANIGAGVLALPTWIATRNPYATHNSVLLLSFVLSFVSAWALVRHLGAARDAAMFSAIAFAFCPFVYARLTHIQLTLVFGLPLSLLAMHRLVDDQRLGAALRLGVVLAVQALACAYYGIFAGLSVGLGTIYYAVGRGLWRSWRYWGLASVAALLTLALVFPFFLPYLRLQEQTGFARTLDDARMYAAQWGDWLASAAWSHRWLLPYLGERGEVLFPGMLTTVLGLAGIWMALRTRSPTEGLSSGAAVRTTGSAIQAVRLHETAGFYALILVLAFWTSFGPEAGLYTLFYRTIPVFTFLRAPVRIAILATLALAVLAAIALTLLFTRLRAPVRRAIGLAACLLLVIELFRPPLRVNDPPPVDEAYRLLAQMPRGAVIEMPFWYERMTFPRHARYMLMSTYHWQPLVNGYSDHIPEEFRRQVLTLSTFPSRSSFAVLERGHARYAVFHLDLYSERSRVRLMEQLRLYAPYLRPLGNRHSVWLYEIVGYPR